MKTTEYALLFVGTKYTWGGESAEQGYDCSGFMQEVLSCIGLDPKGDQTAQKLYEHFFKVNNHSAIPSEGYLLFFGSSVTKITHVAMALNLFQMIEAGGEGSVSTDKGMVRVRPIMNRRDLVACLKIRTA